MTLWKSRKSAIRRQIKNSEEFLKPEANERQRERDRQTEETTVENAGKKMARDEHDFAKFPSTETAVVRNRRSLNNHQGVK